MSANTKNAQIIKGVVYALISSITFGLLPLFAIPTRAEGMSTETLMFYRFLFSVVFLGIYLLATKANFKINKKQLFQILTIGGLGYGLTGLTLVASYEYIPSGIGTTIGFQFPVMIAVFMWIFYKEKLSMYHILALILSIIGVFLLSYSPIECSVSIYGISLLMITNISYSAYIIGVNKSSMRYIDSGVLTFYVLIVCTILCLCISLVSNSLTTIKSFDSVLNITGMSVLTTIISNLTLIMAIKAIGSTTTALLSPLEPLTAIVIGVIVFHEIFNINIFFGVALIILAVLLTILSERNNNKKI